MSAVFMNPSQVKNARRKGFDVITDELGDVLEIWTPGEIKSYIEQVSLGYESLNDDIMADKGKMTPSALKTWKQALIKFRAFAGDAENSWISRLTLGPLRTAQRYAELLEGFRSSYGNPSMKKVASPKAETPNNGPFDFLGGLTKPLIIGAVVIGGAYFLGRKFKFL